MNDRFIRGMLAGVIAGIPTAMFNFTVYYLNLSSLRFSDFSSTLIYGRLPATLAETIWAVFGVIVFLMLLGVLFSFMTTIINSNYYLVKGWFFGVVCWFSSYAITYLFKIPELNSISLQTSGFNFLGASIWGVTLAWAMKWMAVKSKSA